MHRGNQFNGFSNQAFPRERNQQQQQVYRSNNQVRMPNPEPAATVRQESGISSLFLVKIKPGSVAFRYDVDIVNTERQTSLTKSSDDGQRALNRRLCFDVISSAIYKTFNFGMKEGAEVVYDNRSVMFTSEEINLSTTQIPIESHEVSDFARRYFKEANFVVHIQPCATNHILDLSDLSQYSSRKSQVDEDRSLRNFLEMATSQQALNSGIYTPIGTGKLFETNNQNNQHVGNGMVLRCGLVKGVRIVENNGSPSAALVIDAKVCPFYESQNLLDTLMAMNMQRVPAARDLNAKHLRTLQDVRVEVAYARRRSFGIGRFSDKPISEMMAMFEGRKVPMPEFFRLKYQIELKHPNLPGVIPNTPRPSDKAVEVFPIEQLAIMPGQVVPLEKMSKQLSDRLLKSNSVLPQERFSKIMHHAMSISIFDNNNSVLRAFGIQVQQESNEVPISVRPCPRIQFANNRVVNANPERSEWARDASNNAYIDGSEVRNWVVLCSQDQERLVQAYISKLLKLTQRKGMRYAQPISRTFVNNQWVPVFESCVNKNLQFLMLIDSKDQDSHGLLKYFEAKYKILTQHLTIEKVMEVVNCNKNQTLENVVNKINCKNFGLNYVPIVEKCASSFDLTAGEILVIGYDVAHPTAASAQERRLLKQNGLVADSMDPSVVGICANTAKNPSSFVGDYFYQESRKEAVDTLQLAERTEWILEQLKKNRPGQDRPKCIFVLRDGLSEGQFAMALNEELNAIKQGCLNYSPGYAPKFVFVIGTKRHFKKFFAVRNGRVENLSPGSVISRKMVRMDCHEFFMQSHYPLKGVGKPVEYSVPVDEVGMEPDQLQAFLNALCYTHQIVNSAISLPEPIYQADELAKRGRNNYLAMKCVEGGERMPRLPNRLVDHRALSKYLCYKNSQLASTRFSA